MTQPELLALFEEGLPHRAGLARLARRYCPADVDDVLQDVFIKAWQAVQRDTFVLDGGEDGLRHWLFALTKWRALSYLKGRRHQGQLKKRLKAVAEAASIELPRVFDEVLVEELMDTLTLRQHWAFASVMSGMTLKETGAEMGISGNSVGRLIGRGIKQLRRQV